MRRLVEADLEAKGLEELPEDVIRRRHEQALPDGEFVEKVDRPRSDVEMLAFETLQLIELPNPVFL